MTRKSSVTVFKLSIALAFKIDVESPVIFHYYDDYKEYSIEVISF